MARIYISLGSNIDRERMIRAAVRELRAHFGELLISQVFESEAVGFEGDPFLNLVVGCDTDEGVLEVHQQLRAIEDRHGRTRDGVRFSARTLDLDLLSYDDLILNQDGVQIPRDEIGKNAFVLWPLAELAPDTTHPQLGVPYAQLWDEFDSSQQPLQPIAFDWE